MDQQYFYIKVQEEEEGLLKNRNNITTGILHFHYMIAFLAIISFLLITLLFLLPTEQKVIAQIAIEGLQPEANITDFVPATNVTKVDVKGTQIPIVEKISDKGIYNVQLRWNPNPAVLLPKEGFDLTIYFKDPNVAQGVIEEEGTEPEGQEVEREGDIEQEEIEEPGSSMILPLMPVESYDITVHSENGNLLWQKTNQAVHGGRAFERVVFTNEYIGPITIEISNITGGQSGTDSVSFNARVTEN